MNRLKELLTKPYGFTFTMDDVNPELIQILFGNNDDPTTFDFEYEALKQARKHKKKRINKKWAKRYGTISERRRLEGYQMIEYEDGSVGFIK